jgi:integrase
VKGSIRSKGKSSWQIQVYLPTAPDGKRKRYFETVVGQKRDAQRRLNELLVSLDKGTLVPTGRMTVAQHLDNWVNGYIKTNTGTRTIDAVQAIAKNHLIPSFGSLTLKQLTPKIIQSYYGKACEKLSYRTVHKFHRVLSQSLKYAVRQGYLGNNPCDLVDPPKPRKKTMRTLTPAEVEFLLKVAQNSYYYPVIYMAVSSGLRQAELLGLRWRDLDLDMLSISVSRVLLKMDGETSFKEPKTAQSRRRVAMTPKLAVFLREYKSMREVLYLELGKILSLDDLVFTSISGEPLHPSVLSHNFHKLALKSGLVGVRFHDLRHTFASLMFLRGAKPKVISEALGHSSVAFTMDVYSHIIEGMQSDAMALLDEVLPVGFPQVINANLTPR